jgi:hypothetical protein
MRVRSCANRTVLTKCQAHYNSARPHQGIDQRIPDRAHEEPRTTAASLDPQQIHRKPVLSGLINEYTQPPDERRGTAQQPNRIFERHRTAGRAILLLTATDGILGTHRIQQAAYDFLPQPEGTLPARLPVKVPGFLRKCGAMFSTVASWSALRQEAKHRAAAFPCFPHPIGKGT